MPRRSVLFTPGDRPEMMRKAPDSGADVVVFDLEDAVVPDRKPDARVAVRDALGDPELASGSGPADSENAIAPTAGCELCVRVNPGSTATDDLEAVLSNPAARLDGIVLPKVSSASDVERVAEFLTDRDRTVPIFALIESARGVLSAAEIAAVPATDALIFGAEDLAADVGASRTAAGTEVLYARERVVIAAAAFDCSAIDTVYTDFGDAEGLREDAAFARQLGYDGKLAIHPDQIEPIHEAFRPTAEDLEWAERVLEERRAADADGSGVFQVDGEMIDAPLIERAERIVARAGDADGPFDG